MLSIDSSSFERQKLEYAVVADNSSKQRRDCTFSRVAPQCVWSSFVGNWWLRVSLPTLDMVLKTLVMDGLAFWYTVCPTIIYDDMTNVRRFSQDWALQVAIQWHGWLAGNSNHQIIPTKSISLFNDFCKWLDISPEAWKFRWMFEFRVGTRPDPIFTSGITASKISSCASHHYYRWYTKSICASWAVNLSPYRKYHNS